MAHYGDVVAHMQMGWILWRYADSNGYVVAHNGDVVAHMLMWWPIMEMWWLTWK